jgi:hypothetical protein
MMSVAHAVGHGRVVERLLLAEALSFAPPNTMALCR